MTLWPSAQSYSQISFSGNNCTAAGSSCRHYNNKSCTLRKGLTHRDLKAGNSWCHSDPFELAHTLILSLSLSLSLSHTHKQHAAVWGLW